MKSFGEVMREWLYGESGYYRHAKVGRAGDFYTSVSIGRYFGSTIGNGLARFLEEGEASFVEIGASRGELISDAALFLRHFFPEKIPLCRWVIIEPLEELRALQRQHWEERIGGALPLEIFPSLEAFRCSRAFFVANELLDAFPCELFWEGKQGFVNPSGEVVFLEAEGWLKERALKAGVSKGELALGVEELVSSLFQSASSWSFLTFDYGQDFPRNDFSIRLYQNHQPFNFADFKGDVRPFFAQSDITSDVNFEEVSRYFKEQGAQRIYFNRQNRALLEMGLVEVVEKWNSELSGEAYAKEMLSVRPLLDPSLLGERFKCACFATDERLCSKLFWGL